MEKKVKNFWTWLGGYLLATFKKEAISLLIKKVFTGAKYANLKLWLAKVVVSTFWNYIGEPVTNLAVRKGLLFYDTQKGKIQYKKLTKAKKGNDENTYDDVIDDV